mmetsp:Transcript_2640/g.3158  ORF Transcript_2640/g.3158 Transcript_2640/m.3158 type:complete len:186 (-) Transcript_2640:256-813(-)
MRSPSVILGLLVICIASLTTASASVFLPYSLQKNTVNRAFARVQHHEDSPFGNRRRSVQAKKSVAMAIPGYGVTEQIFVGGFSNFLQIYNIVITGRILLSWFPQAQGIAALQPVYAITDPYLNLFRGLIPPIFGLDLSPLAAFFLLNVMTNATAAVGAEIPDHLQKKLKNKKFFKAASSSSLYKN